MADPDRLVSALQALPEGRPWTRGLAARLRAYPIPLTVRGGRHSALTIRYAADNAEGPTGSLVAELTVDGSTRVIASEAGPRLGQPSGGNRDPVRTFRLDDVTYARVCRHGRFTDVVRDALLLYLAAKEQP